MNLNDLIPGELVSAIGWTILHSLWQGLFISILLTALLLFLNNKSARIRSAVAYGALIVIFSASIYTFMGIYSNGSESKILPLNIEETSSITTPLLNDLELIEYGKGEILSFYETAAGVLNNFYSDNLNLIVTLWFFGIMFLTLRMMGGFIYTQRVKHYRNIPLPEYWNHILERINQNIGVSRAVKLFESPLVNYPMVIGYFKPFILMPIGAITGLPQEQVEAILAHELAHIKRADYLLNIIQSVIETLFFFNPAVWWISSIIRKEREYSCDDLAVNFSGNSVTLAKALVNIEKRGAGSPVFGMAAIGDNRSLFRRIKRMSNFSKENIYYQKKLFTIILIITSAASALLFACSSTNSEAASGNHYEQQVNQAGFVTIPAPPEPASLPNVPSAADDTPEVSAPPDVPESPAKFYDDNSKKNFSFYAKSDGKETHWEVTIIDGDITEIFKNGSRIPYAEIPEYEDFIYHKLNEVRAELNELHGNAGDHDGKKKKYSAHFKNFNPDVHIKGMKDFEFNFQFDHDSFNKSMEKLHKELAKLNDMKFDFQFDSDDFKHEWKNNHFDSLEFKEEMKELHKELAKLKDLKIDVDVDWDEEEFEENMREFKEDMKEFHLNMKEYEKDMANFEFDMQEHEKDMAELEIDMKELKAELKILEGFLKEVRSELVSDGYIDDADEDFDFELSEEKMVVNGKTLPDKLHKKYLKIYEDNYGKELEDKVRIH